MHLDDPQYQTDFHAGTSPSVSVFRLVAAAIPLNQGERLNCQDGESIVMKLSEVLSLAGSLAQPGPSSEIGKVLEFEDTGRSETIAGIRGKVYTIEYVDADKKVVSHGIVLTDDAEAKAYSRAMQRFSEQMGAAIGKGKSTLDEPYLRTIGDRGILRVGQSMQLTQLSSARIPDSRFVLPAEPVSMPNMSSILGSMNQNQQAQGGNATARDGSIDGYTQSKSERQQERVRSRTDEEVDKKTDSIVGEAP